MAKYSIGDIVKLSSKGKRMVLGFKPMYHWIAKNNDAIGVISNVEAVRSDYVIYDAFYRIIFDADHSVELYEDEIELTDLAATKNGNF